MSSDSQVLGVVVLVRHGDRQGFYQDPDTYTASSTTITPLGNAEEYETGQVLRSIYLNESSPSYISGVNATLFNSAQVDISADAGGEGGVIVDSAQSLVQGLWPATSSYNTTLANGTTVTGPLGGYQYIPITTVDPGEDVSLEGWADCNTFNDATEAFYNSSEFQQRQSEASSFLNALTPYMNGRSVKLSNMWNIFDFINVNYIHNATFANTLPDTYLAQARDLANFHEYGVFTSPQRDGIGNIAGRTVLPGLISGLQSAANSSDPIKFTYMAIAYKPFLSLFNMTGLAQTYPELATIVDYSSAITFEVRQPSSGGNPVIRFNFRNGTETDFATYNLLGADGDIDMQTFIETMQPAAINSTADWCSACGNSVDRGCALVTAASTESLSSSHNPISRVGAGFLGAGLTAAVVLILLGALVFAGLVSFGKKGKRVARRVAIAREHSGSDMGSVEKA